MTETAPKSTLPYPPVHYGKQFVVLSDWYDYFIICFCPRMPTLCRYLTLPCTDMTDNLGYGKEKRRDGNLDILSGKTTFRDEFRRMLDSVSANGHTLDECKEVLKQNIKLDPGFRDFYRYCKSKDIPVVIVSSGMEPIIRSVLSALVTPEEAAEIDIISNDVDVHLDGTWSIKYRHPTSGYGHDKSQAILPYRALPKPPTLFFFGDGVSGAYIRILRTSFLAEHFTRPPIKHPLSYLRNL
ncbi:HAD-like domain-containing protein [Pisolithus orientalis]|uniref:HAD-like domain-containing protein n=1 Tax=Pisolithus orientalis TaxID=936130 RepID=UPI002224252E|nr:HAD-like domain-containing protein [Pisolithus orientalis]KAI6000382.1 HAD-like domain-containing protein [Pisolithus orientalis]